MKRKTKYRLATGVLASVMFLSGCKGNYLSLFKSSKAEVTNTNSTSSTTPSEIKLTDSELKDLEETPIDVEIVVDDTSEELEQEESKQPVEEEIPETTEEVIYNYESCYLAEETELKSGPGEVYPTIKNLEINEQAIKIFTSNNGYDLVRCNDSFGYIKNENLSYQTEETTVQPEYLLTKHNDIAVTTSILNFRVAPNVESEVIQVFNIETELQVIATVDNGWLMVQHNGKIGFVHGGYTISMYDTVQSLYPELALESLEIKDIVYTTTKLRLRSGNSIEFEELLMLEKYETLRVLGEYDEWYFVMTNERNFGFVSKEYTKSIIEKCIVVDKSCQQLYYYNEGNLIYTTEVTTGKDSTPSDTGLFKIWRKDEDTYLTDNKTYRSHVDFCLYYNAGEAIHDADWRYMFYVQDQPERKKFGSELYHTYGSHGCINTPYEIAEKLFYEVEVGDKVLVHK